MPKTSLVDIEAFRAAAKGGARPEGGVLRASTQAPVATDAERTLRFCFSDGSIDRAGDTIDPNGWETGRFLANPVALWAHNSYDPPIGRAGNLTVSGAKLIGDITFATAEEYAFADTIYRLLKGGYINAVSVGFIPLDWSWSDDKERPYGIDFKKQELLEISPCPVPCNANALIEARAAGIDTAPLVGWAEKVLDQGGMLLVPKAELEQLRKSATATTRYYVEASKALTADAANRIGKKVREWLASPEKVLCLDAGMTLKVIGADGTVGKAGRTLSAKNEADLRAAADLLSGVLKQVEPDLEAAAEADPEADPGEAAESDKAADQVQPADAGRALRARRARALRHAIAA
jgi:HK97 family phage prohead protease